MITKIEIQKEFGTQELDTRLRQVKLRGFPNVSAYGNSTIQVCAFTPQAIQTQVFTPQPSVYRPELDKVKQVAELFAQKGINIFQLNGGVDYFATDDKGEETQWTVIPPVIEMAPIFWNQGHGLDFSHNIGPELREMMHKNDYRQNPQLQFLNFPEFAAIEGKVVSVPEICDGSHRIERARESGLVQNVLVIDQVTPGFPYYAAPKPYNLVHVEPERVEEKLDKVHVLTSPGHKQLYRVFPTGNILSGNLRPRKGKVD